MHTLILGETGTGKSTLMKALILERIYENAGVLIIDPHGETTDDILLRIPRRRTRDVLILDPTDVEFPVAWNPLEHVGKDTWPFLVSSMIDGVKAMWNYTNMATPVMDRMLFNTIAASLAYPDATLLSIDPILTDKKFRARVLDRVSDPYLKRKWEYWETLPAKEWRQLISSTENKAGEFSEDPRIRNVLGQPRSSFDIREMIDHRKIIILRLPQGKLGFKRAQMFGALFLSAFQSAAYSRTLPVPFHVFIDEFYNFDTPTLREILSGIRKFGVEITLANQYFAQLSGELRSSVIANTQRKYIFRLGTEDSEWLHRSYPKDTSNVGADADFDAIKGHDFHVLGSSERAIADAMDYFQYEPSVARYRKVVEQSRRRYGHRREDVEQILEGRFQ